MDVDVLLDGFGTTWTDIRDAARAVEAGGLNGVWLNDHLSGLVHGASYVLESWTVLSALAGTVPRVVLGPLVLNVANRDAGTLAVMAATLQQLSGGRLMLGMGAGGGPGTTYAFEQEALGRTVASDPERRRAVERTVETLREVWSAGEGGKDGFLQPSPPPPIMIAAFGPKMAELAGRIGDGICVPATVRFTSSRRLLGRRTRAPGATRINSCYLPRSDRCPSRRGSGQSWVSIDLSSMWRPRSPTGSVDSRALSDAARAVTAVRGRVHSRPPRMAVGTGLVQPRTVDPCSSQAPESDGFGHSIDPDHVGSRP
jgi:alkanesulfonate monooxygenase SsuD/methylene tetrahydromethanopterin reductase-like flavin-dependent oxidoreductase (luciferase family)